MKRSELNRLVKSIRKTCPVKTTVIKGQRQSAGDTEVTKTGSRVSITKENVSVSKWLRGITTGDWHNAEDMLKLQKAYGMGLPTTGGVLVPDEVSNVVIELLAEEAILRGLPGVRTVGVSKGKITYPFIDDGPTVSWGSENVAISEDTSTDFGTRTLELKKATCLLKCSRELVDWSDGGADAEDILRRELAAAVGREEDAAILEGPGGTQPRGIYHDPRVNNTDLEGAVDLDNLKDAVYQLRNANSELTAWIAHPRTVNDLSQLKDANGNYLLGSVSGDGEGKSIQSTDTLLRKPLYQTTQIGTTNRPDASESYIVGGRWSDLLIGQASTGMRIESSTQADTAFASDQMWIKLVHHVGVLLRHPASFVVIEGIQST